MPSGVSTQAGADHDRRLEGATAAMAMLAEQVDAVIGVDTHTDSHIACLVDHLGGQLAVVTVDADPDGYTTLLAWRSSAALVRGWSGRWKAAVPTAPGCSGRCSRPGTWWWQADPSGPADGRAASWERRRSRGSPLSTC